MAASTPGLLPRRSSSSRFNSVLRGAPSITSPLPGRAGAHELTPIRFTGAPSFTSATARSCCGPRAMLPRPPRDGTSSKRGRGIPRPLLLTRFAGDSSAEQICAEVLGLTKMNWNNDALYDSLPTTLDYAQTLARTIKRMPELDPRPYPSGCSCSPLGESPT